MLDLGLTTTVSPRTDLVLPLLTETLMAPVDTDSPIVKQQCLKIVKALQLLLGIYDVTKCNETAVS